MGDPWAFQRWAFETSVGNPIRKALLLALAVMADAETGRCEAKQETLGQWVEAGGRAVRGHLRALEDAGLIVRRHQYRADGKRRGDEFLLLAPGVEAWPDGLAANGASGTSRPSTSGTGAPSTSGTPVPRKNDRLENDHSDSLRSSDSQQDARGRVPDDFPDELRPHARAVTRILRAAAKRTPNAKAISTMALGNVLMARPYKPLVKAAYDYVAWHDGSRHKDLVSGYRNWLDRTDDLASHEPLTEDGKPVPGAAPAGRSPRPRPRSRDDRLDEQRERARRAHEADQGEAT